VERFIDLSVRKEKMEPCSIFMFLPVSERVEVPVATSKLQGGKWSMGESRAS
jgi:hypothetical protein